MEKTKEEIIDLMAIEMPFHLPGGLRPYIKEAMQIYADQEMKRFYSWICNQVISGRTTEKLFMDFKSEQGHFLFPPTKHM